jgi:hypothetical protein
MISAHRLLNGESVPGEQPVAIQLVTVDGNASR